MIRVGLNPVTGVIRERRGRFEAYTGESHVGTEAETEAMWP